MSKNPSLKPIKPISGNTFGGVLITLLPIIIVLSSAGILFSQSKDYGLMGFDSYPIIISSRVESPADFIGNFTEKLMDGRYPGDFYRPLLNFNFTINYAFGGINPLGYQLTNIFFFSCCALVLYGFVRRLTGGSMWLAPFVSLLVFLLHPIQYEVLPVPPRLSELLCCMFMMLSILTQIFPKTLKKSLPPFLPATFTLLAILSKETGFVLPLLIFVTVLLYSRHSILRSRFKHAMIAVVPHLIVVGIMMITRLAVIGSIGGHRTIKPADIISNTPSFIWRIVEGLVYPQSVMRDYAAGYWLIALLCIVISITLLLQIFKQGSDSDTPGLDDRLFKACIVAAVWVIVCALTYVVAGRLEAWYFLLPVAGWAILAGVFLEIMFQLSRNSTGVNRWAAILTIVLTVTLLVWQTRYSPLIYQYDEWEKASTASRSFLKELQSRIETAVNGSIVKAPPLPMWVKAHDSAPTIQGAAILSDYSVQAWAEIVMPERKVRVRIARNRIERPKTDEVLVLITQRLKGY